MKKLVFLFLSTSVNCSASPSTSCLMKGELYHEDTQTCFPPLGQGPCKVGEWVVLAGVSGVCISKFVCNSGEIPVLDQAGGAVCGCPGGKERFHGSCETLYSQGVCGEGEVLLPKNFDIGRKICPSKFSCKMSDNCPAYKTTRAQAAPRGTNKRKEEVSFVKDMVCNKKARTICCPEENNKSLFSPENLIQSLVTAKPLCTRNPCPDGKRPWVGEDGISKCLFHDDSVENCKFEPIEEAGRITCPLFDLRSVAPIFGRKCKRRRRWINEKCVRTK